MEQTRDKNLHDNRNNQLAFFKDQNDKQRVFLKEQPSFIQDQNHRQRISEEKTWALWKKNREDKRLHEVSENNRHFVRVKKMFLQGNTHEQEMQRQRLDDEARRIDNKTRKINADRDVKINRSRAR